MPVASPPQYRTIPVPVHVTDPGRVLVCLGRGWLWVKLPPGPQLFHYPLVNVYIAMENYIQLLSLKGKSAINGPLSIVMYGYGSLPEAILYRICSSKNTSLLFSGWEFGQTCVAMPRSHSRESAHAPPNSSLPAPFAEGIRQGLHVHFLAYAVVYDHIMGIHMHLHL